jgi:two-component system, OmpR family, sensor histidine kinase ChvG
VRLSLVSLWRNFRRILQRGLASSVSRRIALLNLLGLVAMLLGFLWLNQTRQSVIDARVQSMMTQGEIMASAIAASATVETDTLIIDPDRLLSLQEGESISPAEEAANELEFSVNPERVAPVLRRLIMPTTLRARVYDRDGSMIIDTRTFFARGDIRRTTLTPPIDEGNTLFQRTWNSIKRGFGRTAIPVPKDDSLATGKFPEVARSLKGNSGAMIRVNTDGQTIIYVSTPIQRANSPRGALLLSTQEGDIDQVISDERLSIFLVFLIAAGVMLVLSFLLAGTIADPLRKLAEGAERVRRGTKLRQEIPDLTYRADEIGYLSGTLRDMTSALYQRIEAIESFAADVSHELKNPLTSLRSAVETLPLARNENAKQRLMEVIQHDVRRLDRLISDISDASRLDAELARVVAEAVDFEKLLTAMVAIQNDIPRDTGVKVVLNVVQPQGRSRKTKASSFLVLGHDGRFGQIVTNLIDNAISFSPDKGHVLVTLARETADIVIHVDDHGPGIPDHALERIFERFYTDRPQQGFGQNSGLGLSISRQIAEAYRGQLTAENRLGVDGTTVGARFILRLPAADAG